jgi:hypothetical protein
MTVRPVEPEAEPESVAAEGPVVRVVGVVSLMECPDCRCARWSFVV